MNRRLEHRNPTDAAGIGRKRVARDQGGIDLHDRAVRLVGKHPKAGQIYAQNFEKQFIVFNNAGMKLKEVELSNDRQFVRQILVHPEGRKAIVLDEKNIWCVEVPKP